MASACASASTTTRLRCPHCGLELACEEIEAEIEDCPRCLARSSGALSVELLQTAPAEPARRRAGLRSRRTAADKALRRYRR
jgi:Zn-finger nucleic acid-binding protein